MDLSWDQQRLDSSYRLLTNELKTSKDDLNSLKHEFNNVVDENRRLRQELKEVLAEKLKPIGGARGGGDNIDKDIINNLEGQINLLKKERDNAVGVWQNSLQVISQLEQELKLLQFKTAPDTMSFEFELKKRQEEFARKEANFERELAVLRIESNKKEEDIMDARLKQNELRLQIENLRAQLNQKDQDRRNMIRKEFGYDDALISLQNDISELETRAMSLSKENQYLRDSLQEAQVKNVQIAKNSAELERLNVEYKNQYEESLRMVERFKEEKRKADLELLSQREEHEKLHNAIGELMDEAATRARQEIESLRKIYNTNLEKLIEECSSLEADRNSLAVNLERAIRAKKSIEQEIEKLTTDHLRISTKDNSNYEEAHRRMCVAEREKEQALSRLEAKETEIKKLQSMLDTEKSKNYQIVNELSEKSHKSVRDLERLAEENSKLVNELDEIKKKISSIETDRDNAQKKLTKQIQIHENEMKIKAADFLTKTKTLEDNHSRAMFDLRQLLNMQQRMSNKWKEECHVITSQSEAKFNEMKKNFENLRAHNEKLAQDVQELRRREVENERINDSYLNKVKTLEARVKDAELQAAEATKRMAKQLAKEKLITYEKHLLESDLERSKFVDTFSKGKVFLKNLDANEIPVKPNHDDDE